MLVTHRHHMLTARSTVLNTIMSSAFLLFCNSLWLCHYTVWVGAVVCSGPKISSEKLVYCFMKAAESLKHSSLQDSSGHFRSVIEKSADQSSRWSSARKRTEWRHSLLHMAILMAIQWLVGFDLLPFLAVTSNSYRSMFFYGAYRPWDSFICVIVACICKVRIGGSSLDQRLWLFPLFCHSHTVLTCTCGPAQALKQNYWTRDCGTAPSTRGRILHATTGYVW